MKLILGLNACKLPLVFKNRAKIFLAILFYDLWSFQWDLVFSGHSIFRENVKLFILSATWLQSWHPNRVTKVKIYGILAKKKRRKRNINCLIIERLTLKKEKKRHVVQQRVTLLRYKKENDLSQSDKSTNRGLISEDRSTQATLLFTIPRSCLSRLHRIYL